MEENKSVNNLEILQNIYKKYTDDPLYVYKKCNDSSEFDTLKSEFSLVEGKWYDLNAIKSIFFRIDREWLVIMKKKDTTKTNEDRDGIVDEKYAKFRATELRVVEIVNVNDPHVTKTSITNNPFLHNNNVYLLSPLYHLFNKRMIDHRTTYTVGEDVISPGYTEDKNTVCGKGIHYFKTMESAYFYEKIPSSYSGIGICWNDNGHKIAEYTYCDGFKNGKYVLYYDIYGRFNMKKDMKKEEGTIICDRHPGSICSKQDGLKTSWYISGEKQSEKIYMNGEKFWKWTDWYKNGKKQLEGEHINGKRHGEWTQWNENGEVVEISEYVNGEVVKISEYDNGEVVKISECDNGEVVKISEYVNGEVVKISENVNGELMDN